jgi:hypothetical protein
VHAHLRYSNIFGITEFAHCWITIIENYYPILSYVDKKIDHIFVRNTFLCECDKRRRSRSIAVQGENNWLFCPASIWQNKEGYFNIRGDNSLYIPDIRLTS